MDQNERIVRIQRAAVERFPRDVDDRIAREIISDITDELYPNLSLTDSLQLIASAYNAMRGLGPLQPLIDDRRISEIMINGKDNVFIELDGRVVKSDVTFPSEEILRKIINDIVSRVNREANESRPIVDARLQDGSRVNVVIPPISLGGSVITIRKFPEKAMTFDRLLDYGSLSHEAAHILRLMVLAKYNIFVSGGTGSGKTSFLNALSNFIPEHERIITIEDSAELQIETVPNIVRLETRAANVEGRGEITIKDLIKASLRMRPERVIVGEVRGAEALDMLQAMNTGHDGSLSTGHANSSKDMLSRLETMVLSAAPLPLEAVRSQIASALDIIVHLGRLRDFSRRVLEVSEVLGLENGEIKLNPLFIFHETGETEDGKIVGSLVRTENPMLNNEKMLRAGLSTGM